jgi:hypothetical protein
MQQESGISDLHLEMFVFLYCFVLQTSPPFHHLLFLCFLAIYLLFIGVRVSFPTLPIRFRPAQIISFSLFMSRCHVRVAVESVAIYLISLSSLR